MAEGENVWVWFWFCRFVQGLPPMTREFYKVPTSEHHCPEAKTFLGILGILDTRPHSTFPETRVCSSVALGLGQHG